MQRIEINQDFALPVERVYTYLSEHENLGPLFGARVARVRDGDTSRNGVGSVRSLRVGPLPAFEETVTKALPNELIEYRITQGSPLENHRGELRFAPKGGRVDADVCHRVRREGAAARPGREAGSAAQPPEGAAHGRPEGLSH